ncbi:hypothetical protein L211DRAFT_399589 [Terfezia boudieri ATCC MYA-4762]|uniref:Uncharacterized protein n=1 Tax=Terfezia boudieri ATCC MYA-4762 TaxID=1051890 RepID=A0A3N4M0M7_9PEZI|nr:hypothetical protein L211DRAFT_399589 [Terfezia boudieri ATCC MYA-4762]
MITCTRAILSRGKWQSPPSIHGTIACDFGRRSNLGPCSCHRLHVERIPRVCFWTLLLEPSGSTHPSCVIPPSPYNTNVAALPIRQWQWSRQKLRLSRGSGLCNPLLYHGSPFWLHAHGSI